MLGTALIFFDGDVVEVHIAFVLIEQLDRDPIIYKEKADVAESLAVAMAVLHLKL